MTPLETILWVLQREIDGTNEAIIMVGRNEAQEGHTSLGPGTIDRLAKRKQELQRALEWAEKQKAQPN